MVIRASVQDRSIALNGRRFHYRDWGNEGAQTLLLLHGLSSHARTWDGFAAAMQNDFHILALDQRGHGETEWADDYYADRMVEDVAAFVRALGLERIALLGLSMGGRNAYMYAALHPDVVERLVIVDIGPEPSPLGRDRARRRAEAQSVFESPEEAFQAARAANHRPSDENLRHRVTHNLTQRSDRMWTFRYDPALTSAERPVRRPDPSVLWPLMAKISCPTLLLRGSDSDVLSEETAERMAREIPACTLVEIADSGHSIPLDRPAEFLAAARSFLVSTR
jgi:pimeloyl-ACP methyl ester carboxylesterase